MTSHWPTAAQQPGATPAQIEYAGRWRDMPKVVFSSTTRAVDWNARLVTCDALTEIARLKAEDGPMDIPGAPVTATAFPCRADRRVRDRHPSGPRGRGQAVLHVPRNWVTPQAGGYPDVS